MKYMYIILTIVIVCIGIYYVYNKIKPQNPMLKYNPATYYTNEALRVAEAIRNKKYEDLAQIISRSPDVASDRGTKDLPLLAWALGHDDIKAFRTLVEGGADVNTYVNVGDGKMSVIGVAIGAKEKDFFDILLNNKVNPNGIPNTEIPLVTAFYAGKKDRMDELLKAGADINQADSVGKTLLIIYVLSRDYVGALELIKKGANPHIAMKNGTSVKSIIEKFPLSSDTEQGKAQKELLRLIENN